MVVPQFVFALYQLVFQFNHWHVYIENYLWSPFLDMWAGRYQPTARTQVIQSKNKLRHYQNHR